MRIGGKRFPVSGLCGEANPQGFVIANTVPLPFVPPNLVVEYSVPFTAITFERGNIPSVQSARVQKE